MTAQDTATIERRVRIEARPEIVFDLLTDAEQMLRWQGVEATLEPVPGGIYRVQLTTQGQCTAGRFVAVVPYSRIVFTWGWDPPTFPVPAGRPSRSRWSRTEPARCWNCGTAACRTCLRLPSRTAAAGSTTSNASRCSPKVVNSPTTRGVTDSWSSGRRGGARPGVEPTRAPASSPDANHSRATSSVELAPGQHLLGVIPYG